LEERQAQAIMQDALKANPEIDLVYAHNDPMAHGAYLAARQAGRSEQIKFIGIDANPDEGQRWVRTGELTAAFMCPTPGEKGLEVALDILQGTPAQKRYILPTRLFNKDNVDAGGEPVE
jgi:ribose transport system substrate-binding protein